MAVHREFGGGFSEIVYKDALEYELTLRNIPFQREVRFQVNYKDIVLPHEYFADFVVFNEIILEAKSVSELKKEHYEKLINYLAVSKNEVGFLINFRQSSLQYKRIIRSKERFSYPTKGMNGVWEAPIKSAHLRV
jgi:GxxExxY protein